MLFKPGTIAFNKDWKPERQVRLGELMGADLAVEAHGESPCCAILIARAPVPSFVWSMT